MAKTDQSAALERLAKLESLWIGFIDTLKEIIEKRDWETLGYSSFTEMWGAKLAHLPMAPLFRAHVAFAMLKEGTSPAEASDAVHGLTENVAESYKRQMDTGLTPESVTHHNPRANDTTTVREHERRLPSESDTIHLRTGTLRKERYTREANRLGLSLEEFCVAAIEEKVEQLRGAKVA